MPFPREEQTPPVTKINFFMGVHYPPPPPPRSSTPRGNGLVYISVEKFGHRDAEKMRQDKKYGEEERLRNSQRDTEKMRKKEKSKKIREF